MPLSIQALTLQEFGELRQEWNRLLSQSLSDTVFLRWEWMHTWWTLFKKDRTLVILTARENGRLVGVAPFYCEREKRSGTRVLRFCSEELSPDYLDLIAEPGQETQVARQMIDHLKRWGQWDVLMLDNLRAESILLKDPSLLKGWSHTTEVSMSCPYLRVEGTFDDYYQASPLTRFSLKKKLRNLQEDQNVTHRIVDDEAGLAHGIEELFRLHEKRSWDKRSTSSFALPEVKPFHFEVSRLFLKERILDLELLYAGDVAISAFYAFRYKNKAYVFQTGLDPLWKKWSVGAVLFYLGVQRAFHDGLSEFDFLKGNESYKTFWANASRDEMRLTVYNKTFRGTLSNLSSRVKTALRRLKRALPSAGV